MTETRTGAPAATERESGGRARSWAGTLRRLPDRLLHPLRRKRASAKVAAAAARLSEDTGPPLRILVLCHGNICRSPYAEGALRRRLPPGLREWVVVESAGFIGPGRRSPPEALEVARERGVDLFAHVSTVVDAGAVGRADLILAVDPWQARAVRARFGVPAERVVLLGDVDPERIEARTIRDPILQPREVFEASFARIDRCVEVCVAELSRHAPGSGSSHSEGPGARLRRPDGGPS